MDQWGGVRFSGRTASLMTWTRTVGNAGGVVIPRRVSSHRVGVCLWRIAVVASTAGTVAACSVNTTPASLLAKNPVRPQPGIISPAPVPLAPAEMAAAPPPPPQANPHRRLGEPYQIAGTWYEPRDEPDYDRAGMASWYGAAFDGKLTANGEIFDRTTLSAAHPTLPLPSYVRVTNLENARSVVVRVNDRGPYKYQRLIDVSERTADLLGFHHDGMTQVRVEYLSAAPLEREEQATLLASYHEGTPAGAPATMVASLEPDPSPGPPADEPTETIAFASEETQRPAADEGTNIAMASLTESYAAGARILMAFEVADGSP